MSVKLRTRTPSPKTVTFDSSPPTTLERRPRRLRFKSHKEWEHYLNALLADLQNTIHSGSGLNSSSPGYGSLKKTSRQSPGAESPISQVQGYTVKSSTPTSTYGKTQPSAGRKSPGSYGSGGSPGYGSLPSAPVNEKQKAYNNLSELDTWKCIDILPRKIVLENGMNGTLNGSYNGSEARSPVGGVMSRPTSAQSTLNRPTVDSLLNELAEYENSGDVIYAGPKKVVITVKETKTETGFPGETELISQHVVQTHAPAASSATRELDDLMADLSNIKKRIKKKSGNVFVRDNDVLAAPQIARLLARKRVRTTRGARGGVAWTRHSTSAISASGRASFAGNVRSEHRDFFQVTDKVHQVEYARPAKASKQNLESMLGHLQADMSKQGVNTSQKGCCNACDKPIVGQVITALGKTWHPEHFTCAHCSQELGTRNFFERDGKPYCEPDYHNLFSPRCAYCNGPILDKCVTALEKTWHMDHFFCAQCGKQFGEEGFHERDGKPFCRDDYFDLYAPKCGSCNRAIMENYISALNSQWHPDCFVCRDCKLPVQGKSFYAVEGKPVCPACIGADEEDE
ncbi:unnamed protein product [Brassicogethes aeneus]|uniref:LIM zinc-binding domain-containing protein n=1 Tax=Brassicogethes aeneus TaxID=1431903 RepID=A0A9P0B5C5_BRAAE|nr:unnamed protein product [Brassicogethes aeneus]